jgi:hypothetical protein
MLATKTVSGMMTLAMLGLMSGLENKAQAQDFRALWVYSGAINGSFVQNRSDPALWTEQNSDATFSFREVYRTSSYVELYDASRDLTVRLYSTVSFIRHPGTNGQFLFLYHGSWR